MTNSKLWTPQYIVIISITLLFFLSIHVINSVFPIYVMSFSNNPTIAGLMLTAFMSAAIVTRFVLSLYILNINFRKTIILNLILLFICLMLSYDRESIYFLLLIRFIEGVNFGIISTILATQVSYIIPTKQTGKGFNYFALATTLGASLSPALAIMLFHSSSFNTVIIVTTILVVLMLLFLIFVKSFQTPATQKSLNNKLTMLFEKRAILPCALMFLLCITFSSVFNFIEGLGREINLEDQITWFFVSFVALIIGARLFAGSLFDRGYGIKLIYISSLTGFLGLAILMSVDSIGFLVVAGAFYGFAYGVMHPTLQAFAVSTVSAEKRGTANVMFLTGMDLGMAIGSVMLGFIVKSLGFAEMYGVSSLFLIIIPIILFLFIKLKVHNFLPAN